MPRILEVHKLAALAALPLLLAMAPAATGGAGSSDDPGVAGVRAAEDGWSKAFVTGDAAFLEGLLDPAYVSVNAHGQAQRKAEIVALANRYATEHPGTAATPMPPTSTIDVKGTAAVVTHHNPADTSVDVFFYADGRWHAWYSQHTAIAGGS